MALGRPAVTELLGGVAGEPTAPVAARVRAARELAARRGVRCNAELPGAGLARTCPLGPGAEALLERHLRTGGLSARGLHRVWRVARTLADLHDPVAVLDEAHVAGALALRMARDGLLSS
ncbi:MAG: magnesium chelatase subunit ChlI family protein [Acidimicrobiales bacterium]